MTADDQNQQKNKNHYERLYANYNVNNILHWINHLDSFLEKATTTETSWFALYKNDFRNRIVGKKVLEMGCGDCNNAAVMAALGANVYANDIAATSGDIVKRLNESFKFQYPIKFVEGDFLVNELPSGTFDFIIGKAFLHHLTLPVEERFLNETARLLKSEGEARFFEPAVNSRLLDEIRWYLPIGTRPSKFNQKAFKKWKQNDPHPSRSLSSEHFKKVGRQSFKEVEIIPFGTLERFGKLFKWGERRNQFKRWALKKELQLPRNINSFLNRSQLIIYKKPLQR